MHHRGIITELARRHPNTPAAEPPLRNRSRWGGRPRDIGGLRGFAGWLGMVLSAVAGVAAEPVWVTGITEPIKDVTMAFALVGVVGARPVQEGAAVKEGQLVIELDKRLEELDAERKRLARDQARSELDRLKSLAERNAISVSREDLDKKQAEYDIARVEHEVAIEVVHRRQILSPVDGCVAQFYKDVGEKCEEQQPVVRVVDTRRFYFVANVDPKLGPTLTLGAPVTLELELGTGPVRFDGAISYLGPVVDPASGLLRIKAVFENREGRVRPGVAGRLALK